MVERRRFRYRVSSGFELDFNPTGALEGVRAFKKSFGVEVKDTPVVRLRPRWRRGFDRWFGRRSHTDSKDAAETIT